ncbi:hypothetical protein AAHA92_29907 [Salvia divinorum]|uniref:Retrotransposon gag domain-containing protein n=1 Tax=Salvia divinorum TaxID=28513 RepID=A0ABD1FZW2_SALDI
MAVMNEEDPKIGSLNAHLNGEPSSAIIVSAGQSGIEVKNNVLVVMPHFYGRRIDNPYEFLHEFCKLCGIQRRPAGSTEEDYRLRALPFALKGEADTWFMRLPPNSIRMWSDFKAVFLEYFFPATRTNALKKEIQGATQEEDETLASTGADSRGCWTLARIIGYLVNSASGGDFSRLRVSEAKRILSRLIDAKKAYDSPCATLLRRGTVNAASEQPEDKMEARMDKLEKAIISALEKTKQPTPTEKCQAPLGLEESYQYYNPLAEAEYPAQVYAAGSWNTNESWNPGKQQDAPWRDHPNFRWSDADLNQPAPQTQNFPNRGEGPSSWSSRNPEGTHQLGNRGLHGNINWSSGNQPNWPSRHQQGNPADSYILHHQRGFQGGGASQPPQQGGPAPHGRYNQGTGSSGNFHPKGRGSGQPFQRPQQRHVDDYAGDLLNNDMVNKLQDTQNEQKAALDMLARQLSQIATSISEMRGNEGKIPATVKLLGKENISSIDLRPNEEQVRPKRPLKEEESSRGIGELIKEAEEAGAHRKPEEVASEENDETEVTEEVPNEIKENISMIATKQKVPTKHSDPGMFTPYLHRE